MINKDFSINDMLKIKSIINNFEQNKLNQLGQAINQKIVDKKISLEEKGEEIKISKKRSIKIYKDFILINKYLLIMIENNFNIKYQISMNFKFSTNIKNILTINNENQNICLIGNYNNYKNFFNIEFVLDYKNNIILMKEASCIIQEGNDNYLKNHLIFNENIKNDYISPIFDASDNLVGFGYKYNDNISKDYSKYYFSNELINIIRLNIFYNQINNIFNNTNDIVKEKFYLVNKDWLNRYKNNYEYDEIKNELNNNNKIKNIINSLNQNEFNSFNMKVILSIIKNMTIDINIFNQNIETMKKQYNSYINFEPDKIIFNYFDQDQKPKNLIIYNNFEIISFKFGKMFNEENKIISEGIINNGKIFINLPFHINQKDIWIAGYLNNDNILIHEYYFIYERRIDSNNHINFICKSIGLRNYLNSVSFLKNSVQIIKDNKVIGHIFKIYSNNYNNNVN